MPTNSCVVIGRRYTDSGKSRFSLLTIPSACTVLSQQHHYVVRRDWLQFCWSTWFEDQVSAGMVSLVQLVYLMPQVTEFCPRELLSHFGGEHSSAWTGARVCLYQIIVGFLSKLSISGFAIKKGRWVIRMPEGRSYVCFACVIHSGSDGAHVCLVWAIGVLFALTPWGDVYLHLFHVASSSSLNIIRTTDIYTGEAFWLLLCDYAPLWLRLRWKPGCFAAGTALPTLSIEDLMRSLRCLVAEDQRTKAVDCDILFCNSRRAKTQRSPLLPGVFGINEPVMYGLPMVLNHHSNSLWFLRRLFAFYYGSQWARRLSASL